MTNSDWLVCTDHVEHIWFFHIQAKLHLNFTLYQLYFVTKVIDCSREQLKLHNPHSPSGKAHVYCGQHSAFSIYPSFGHVRAVITISTQMFVKCAASFSLLEMGSLCSVEPGPYVVPQPYLVQRFKTWKSSVSYAIQVKRTFSILLTTSRDVVSFAVFDCPSFLCPVLSNRVGMLETSSHQCIVQVLVS